MFQRVSEGVKTFFVGTFVLMSEVIDFIFYRMLGQICSREVF